MGLASGMYVEINVYPYERFHISIIWVCIYECEFHQVAA